VDNGKVDIFQFSSSQVSHFVSLFLFLTYRYSIRDSLGCQLTIRHHLDRECSPFHRLL
jgi:hypothetical protein